MSEYFLITQDKNVNIINFLFSALSIEASEQIKAELYKSITEQNKSFVINMSKCDFLPSVALGLIVGFNKRVLLKGGRVVVCCLLDQVKTLFKITRLDEIFDVYESCEDAVNSFHV